MAAQSTGETAVQAKEADGFVASMGVNVHMESTTAPYYKKNYTRINDRLRSLGMRHVRDEMNQADPSFKNRSFIDEIAAIGRAGYTLTGLIEGGNDYPGPEKTLETYHVLHMILNLWPTIDSVEGPNEPDNTQFAYGIDFLHYPWGAIFESEDLWQIVKHGTLENCREIEGCEKIKDLPVLAMSEGNANDFGLLEKDVKKGEFPPAGDYSSAGNMHAYQGGRTGSGFGPSSGLSWYISRSHEWTRREPLWTTEMGYHNNTYYLDDGEQQGVSERAAAIYLPAAFLTGFHDDVVRTFSYELIDETRKPPKSDCPLTKNPKSPRCEGEGYYGLLHWDLTPKPVFTALKNLSEILAEPGGHFEPGSLTMSFSARAGKKTYRLRYTLLEKSDGDYYLAVWNDIPVFEIAYCKPTKDGKCAPVAGRDIATQEVPVTVSFAGPESFTVYAPNDPSGVNPTKAYTLYLTPMSITVDLPPQVLIIKIASAL
jgi:hypothetical protein